MPSIICKCGEKIGYGAIPNPVEFLFISDTEYDAFEGSVDTEFLYKKMKSILKCDSCNRLWIFWSGFNADPISYAPD